MDSSTRENLTDDELNIICTSVLSKTHSTLICLFFINCFKKQNAARCFLILNAELKKNHLFLVDSFASVFESTKACY